MNKEIEELLKGMRDVSNTEGCSMNLDRYLVKLLLSYIEQLENNRDKAIEYMQDFIFEPLLVQEDRKLIMYNENLRNFEKILKGGSDENK